MDHDQRFKTLFQIRLRDLLILVLGETEAARYDLDQVDWLQQEIFTDPPEGQRLIIDLVCRVKVREAVDPEQATSLQPWLILLHIEIESRDSVAQLRQRIYEYRHELRRQHQIPVLSIGVYLSVALGGLGWDSYVETYGTEEILRFRFPYIGLPGLDAFDYATGDNPLGVALSALMRVDSERQGELKSEAMERVSTAEIPELHRYLLAECVEAYLPLDGPQLEDYEKRLRTPKYGGAMKVGVTSRELGQEEGERRLLVRSLERKFGTLAPAVEARVRALKSDELVDLNLRIGTAQTLAELGLDTKTDAPSEA